MGITWATELMLSLAQVPVSILGKMIEISLPTPWRIAAQWAIRSKVLLSKICVFSAYHVKLQVFLWPQKFRSMWFTLSYGFVCVKFLFVLTGKHFCLHMKEWVNKTFDHTLIKMSSNVREEAFCGGICCTLLIMLSTLIYTFISKFAFWIC